MARQTKAKADQVTLTIEEAIENITNIAEMPLDEKTPVGIIQNAKITTDSDDFEYKEIQWLFPEDEIVFVESITPSYQVILDHLQKVYGNETTDYKNEKIRRGLQSIMEIAAKAAYKINKYFELFDKRVDFTRQQIYIDLQHFYVEKLSKKFEGSLEGKDQWERQWQKSKYRDLFDLEHVGLKNFETVLEDSDYELFFIRNDKTEPLISQDLIRNIKLFEYYDEKIEITDDFFLKIEKLKNKDLHFSSKQILKELDLEIKEFYKNKIDRKTNKLARLVNKSVMALLLAANPKNLFKRDKGKTCLKYFKDFQVFLRSSFDTGEYQKAIAVYEGKKRKFLLHIVHKLSKALFSRLGGIKKEITAYIFRMINKTYDKNEPLINKNLSYWNQLLEKDDNIRRYLKKYPNGPLIEIIKVLEEEDEENILFDPIMQGNIPEKLFEVAYDKKKVDIMHIPSPTIQEIITKAKVDPEFYGFLRNYVEEDTVHLIINLQDRNSYFEKARANIIEQLSNNVEFEKILNVITMSYGSDFYHQTGKYETITNAIEFKKELIDEIFSGEEFFYSSNIHVNELKAFGIRLYDVIFEKFFLSKIDLAREERLNFIELFYHLLILKVMEISNPSSLNFMSKDGVDSAAAFNASLFMFIILLNKKEISDIETQYLIWLLYSPAMLMRKRAINAERLIRKVSFLSFIDSKKEMKKDISSLFKSSFINKLNVNYLD